MKPESTASNRPANMAALALAPVGSALWDHHDGVPSWIPLDCRVVTRASAFIPMGRILDTGVRYPGNKMVYRTEKCQDHGPGWISAACIYDDTGYLFGIRIPESGPVIAGCGVCGEQRGSQTTPAMLTLEGLADKINAHLEAGGYVLDYYQDDAPDLVIGAVYDEGEDGRPWRDSSVRLRCPFRESHWGTTIPVSDVLEDRGNVVAYRPTYPLHSFLGELRFLIPAPLSAATAPSETNLNP